MFKQGERIEVTSATAQALRNGLVNARLTKRRAEAEIENAQRALSAGLKARDIADSEERALLDDMMRLGVGADTEEDSAVNACAPFPPAPPPNAPAPYAKPWGRT